MSRIRRVMKIYVQYKHQVNYEKHSACFTDDSTNVLDRLCATRHWPQATEQEKAVACFSANRDWLTSFAPPLINSCAGHFQFPEPEPLALSSTHIPRQQTKQSTILTTLLVGLHHHHRPSNCISDSLALAASPSAAGRSSAIRPTILISSLIDSSQTCLPLCLMIV